MKSVFVNVVSTEKPGAIFFFATDAKTRRGRLFFEGEGGVFFVRVFFITNG
jgi:hypothetical protein